MAEQPRDEICAGIWDAGALQHLGYAVGGFRAFVDTAGYDATEGMWSLGKDGWKQLGATWAEPGFSQARPIRSWA